MLLIYKSFYFTRLIPFKRLNVPRQLLAPLRSALFHSENFSPQSRLQLWENFRGKRSTTSLVAIIDLAL